MKKYILFAAVLFAFVSASAQKNPESRVEKAVATLRQAIIDGDSVTLMRITDPRLSYGHSAGKIENRQEFVSSLASGRSDFANMDLTNQSVIVAGKTAIVRHNLAADITDNGKKASVRLGVMLVWHKENKEWKLLARQAFKLP